MTVHTEILLIAIAVSIACAIPGVFLVLRRMSMMADAITHTVFLGIVLAFFMTEDLNSPFLLVGATLVGVGTVWLIFPLLFSIAIILVSLYSGNAHLDVDTALLGEIAFAPFDRWIVNGTDLGPVSLWISLGVALINLILVMLFYKELQLSTFDPLLAGLFGFMPALIHYVLMTMVSLTVVASFQAVGAILVIGLMIGPAVIAYLWTDSVKAMLTSIAVIATPKTGYIATYRRQRHLRRHYRETMMLCHIYTHMDTPIAHIENGIGTIHEHLNWRPDYTHQAASQLKKQGLLYVTNGHYVLTDKGIAQVKEI
ncbi:MAG: metal ABC transporter permease, partial [Veillonella sp.]|nr:metal ABC transporter permease [Veillonella sp.]